MAQLRAPGGCPWDREQTFDSIKPYTLEETYEVLDAIDARDWKGLREELGDFMLQAVFFAQMAAEANLFSIEDSLDAINEKLVRRHPHIFGDASAKTAEAVKKRWDEIKAEEKATAGSEAAEAMLLDGVSPQGSGVGGSSANRVKGRRSWIRLGECRTGVRQIGRGSRGELRAATDLASKEDEVGDMLFVIVNIARFMKVDPESRPCAARMRNSGGDLASSSARSRHGASGWTTRRSPAR